MDALIIKNNRIVNIVVCESLEDTPLQDGETAEPSTGVEQIGWTKTNDGWQAPPTVPHMNVEEQLMLQANQIQSLTLALLQHP